MSKYKYVHHNKCKGGHAVEEIDGKTYCYGRVDAMYDFELYTRECQDCPRFFGNNEDKIEEWIKEHEHE